MESLPHCIQLQEENSKPRAECFLYLFFIDSLQCSLLCNFSIQLTPILVQNARPAAASKIRLGIQLLAIFPANNFDKKLKFPTDRMLTCATLFPFNSSSAIFNILVIVGIIVVVYVNLYKYRILFAFYICQFVLATIVAGLQI